MSEIKSLFARKLRDFRASNGQHGRMTQEQLADLLGLSVDAVGKYERSVSFIRGDLEHRLTDRLGWTRAEVLACREDWEIQHRRSNKSKYRLLDDTFVKEHFDGSWNLASLASLRFADAEFHDLPPELEVNTKVFLPIYETFRDNWAAVMFDNQMVAKWSLLLLLPADVALFRTGQLLESNLSVDRLHQPILPGKYFGYCPVLIVRSGHESASTLLLSSFVHFLESLAERDVVLDGIGTISCSHGGAQICRELGMTKLGSHSLSAEFGIWELPGAAIPDSIFGRRSALLRRCYAEAFQ